MSRWIPAVWVLAAAFDLALLAAPALAGPSPEAQCEAAKNKEAGKYSFCLQKAEQKLVKTAGLCSGAGSSCYLDADCPTGESCSRDMTKYNGLVAKCDAKFSDHWAKWEQKAEDAGTSCPTNGDESSRQAELIANANRTAWRLSGQARFADNGDGTITDNQTGLMWEKKVKLDSTTDYANLEDADNHYQWAGVCSVNTGKTCQPDAAAAATCAAGVEGVATSCDQCAGGDGTCTVGGIGMTIWQWINQLNTLGFADYSNWRVPTRAELVSIVDYNDSAAPMVDSAFQGEGCGASCTAVDDPACSCTQSDHYWSASAYAPYSSDAWIVSLNDGGVDEYNEANYTDYVRAVRGGS